MSKQTAIANINRMILQEREQGATRKRHSSLDTINELLEEERRRKEEEEQQRKQQEQNRRNSQFQAERNADISNWIRGMSPTALEDQAQQARLDGAKGIYSSTTGTQQKGSGRSFETKLEIPTPSATGATSGKKRAQDSLYLKYLDEVDASQQATQGRKNQQAQRRSYTMPSTERTKNDRTYGLEPPANRAMPAVVGNIDLYDRPVYRNEDGSISTVDSVSFGTDDGREVLVPTIGRDAEGNAVRWTNEEAWQHYLDTGEHLGIFNSVDDATEYAQSLHKSQEKRYASERTVSDIYNDTAAMNRWRELAGKEKLTAEEKKEAKAAVKELKYAFTHWNAAPTGAEMAQQTELTNLYNSLLYKSSALASGFAGAVKALGVDWLSDRVTGITEKALGAESPYTSLRQITEEAQAANPLAFAAGSMTASITELSAISGIVGEVMQGVQWFTQAAPWIQRAVTSAITFGISGLQSGITSTQSKEEWDEQERKKAELAADFGAEYTPKEYSAVRQAANVWFSTVTGALAGAAGGALETAFGIGTTEALKKAGLQFHTPLRLLAKGLTGTGFAIGSTAVQEVSKFLQYPEGYTPSVSEIGTNLAIAFLYSTISATLSETKNIKSNRETLQKLMNVLSAKYDAAERQMAGLTGIERAEAAGEVAALTNRIRESINNSPGMSGVDKEILALLQMMDDRMAAIIAGGNGLLGAGDIMAQAEAAGFSPNTALSLPAWNGTPSQPTNLEQAVQFVGANVPAPWGETPALPEAPAQENNLPAWYAAYQNAVRPIDQPLQQRPDIPAPSVPAPAAQAGGAMGPAETAQPAVFNEARQVENVYTPQLKQILERSPKVRTVEYNGEKYVTDGAVGVAVGDEGKAFAQTNYQATDIDPAPLAKYGIDKIAKSGTIVSEQPYVGSTKGGRGIYYFPTEDGILAFGKEYVDALDAGKRDPKSGTIRVELATVGKDQIPILVSAGKDGSVEGFLFGTDPRSYKVSPGDLETLERAELKTVGGTAKATNPPVPEQRTMQTAGAAGKDAKAQRAAQQALATQRKRALADNSPQSLQEMGFRTAGEGTTHIFAENQWDGEMKALAEGLRAEGIEPTYFTGNAMNAEGKKVPALLEGNKLAIQADNRSKTIQTLAEQALGHDIAVGAGEGSAPRLTVRSGNGILDENRMEVRNETQSQREGSAGGAEEVRAELLDGNGRRVDDQRAGEQAGRLDQSAEVREQAARQHQTAVDRRSVSGNYGTEKVDNRSGLGVTGAVAGSSSTVLSRRQVQEDPELRRIESVIKQWTGLDTTFVLGNVAIEDAPQGARGVYTGGRFIVRADHDDVTATQIALHELYHWYAEKDPTLNERMRQRILSENKGTELQNMIARYVDAIGPSLGITEDISEEDFLQAKDAILEEIYANAYAGINAYGAGVGNLTESVRAETGVTERNLSETAAATAGKTGPPVPSLRVAGSRPRTAAEAMERYSLNPQTIDYAIKYTAKDEQVKTQLGMLRDDTVELAEIQNTITKSLGRKASRNIHDMNDYLQKNRKVWKRLWDIQQELADNGIRTDFVTMPGTKNEIDGKKVPGGLKGLPIEYVESTTGKRFKFTAFWRNIPQMLMDSMTHDSRERLRTEIVRGVEDAYRRKTGEQDLMPYLKDQFPVPKKKEIEKVAGERKLKNIRNQTQKRVQPPIRDAEKTVGALNLNSACPMFTIGNNGCYLDACYLTQMANGATGTNLFRSAWYTGELLQLAQSDIELMNELGGLRVNGVGDTTLDNKSQLKDALRHAGMRGLKVKIITKQRATLEVLKEMHDAGQDISHITVQPSMDNLWIPAKLDDAYGAGVRGNTQLAKTVKAGKLEAAAAGYDDMFGRATKVKDGVLYRKYGFTPEQIKQMQEDYPFVSITPRYVVCTPREIAEIALNRNGEFVNGGKLIQTLMHGKVPEGCESDYGKRSPDDKGGEIINFGGARHVVERKDGKWHFFGEYIKKDGSVGKIIDGPRTPYGKVQAFVEGNYTKAEQDKIWLTLKNQMCCQANDFKDACAGCQSLCARGCAAFSSEDFDYRKYSEREKEQAMSMDEPIEKLRVAGGEQWDQPETGKLRVAQGNKPKRTMKFSVDTAKDLYRTEQNLTEPMNSDDFLKSIREESKAENYFPKGLSKEFLRAITRKAVFTRTKLYRGIEAAEYDFLLENKFLKSKGEYNFSNQVDQTLADEDPATALAYATSYAPNEVRKKHYEGDMLPSYIIEFVNSPDLNMRKNEVQESYTKGTIDQDYITRIFEINYDPETHQDMVQDVTDRDRGSFPKLGEALNGLAHGEPMFFRDKTTGTILYAVQGDDGWENGQYISEKDPSMIFDYDRMEDPVFAQHGPKMLGISGNESDLEAMKVGPDGTLVPEKETRYSAELEDDYNKTALLSEETVDKWLKDYASKGTPKYAQAYVTRMTPDQFLRLTTSTMGRLAISQQTQPLDAQKLIEATRDNPLQIRIADGEVVGHEGRHRANALKRAGVNSIPVLVFDSSNKYSKETTPEMTLRGQDFGSSRSYATETLRDLTPLSYENRDKIVQDYGTQPALERMQTKYSGRKTIQFSADEPQSSAEYAQMNRRDAENAERAQEALEERTLGGRRLLDTPALKKLGVKVNGSVGRYANTQQLLAKNKAAKELKKQAQDAEKRLQATDAEIDFASGIAAGVYDEEDIPSRLRKNVVMELADYYFASDSANLDTLIRVRADINRGLLLEAEDLMDDLDIKPQNMVLLNERTPERNLRSMFGERGNDIAEWLIQPVRENESEKIRWFNKQMDRVREFTDSKGQKRELSREESALTMKVMEGRAAAEMIADLETNPKNRYGKQQAKNIRNAAENIRKGGSAADAAREFSLGDRERDLAEKYASWQNTLEELKQADSTIVENAAKEYAKIFDEFYEAINDFLAAHGYEPIGYIKGYAPHMQPEENQNLLEKAFGAMGINTQVTELPANIAGQTANYKPNKRWNPYFLQRTGSVAQYDIVKAYESYVDYLSDIFYHTDDIMRARQLVRWIRKSYAKDEIKSQLDYIETIREAPIEVKQTLLRDAGEIGQTSVLSPMDVEEKMQEYVEKLFSRVTDSTQYSNLVMWLENYANILAGKQSFADRGWEYSTGRKSLNFANRLNAAFQKANVAGNLSSAINQTAQVPMIAAELGERDFLSAVFDVVTGKVRQGNFLQDSDFLMEKEGKDYLYADRADKFINALFTPASVADHLVSTVAVRGAFNKAIRQGKSYAEAMRYADDFGRKLMGSRAKGSRPLAYESKGFFSKMIHQFQVECANSWDHIVTDLPSEFKEIAKTQGKNKAARALAAVLVRAILGTFLLNRLTDELYGGTPAPFDILGLTANFIASGQGLTTNNWIRKVIDNAMEKVTGQRIFGTKDTETKFSLKDASEELIYNVMNDLPLARNVAAVLGLGDESLPLPGASGEFSAMKKAVDGMLKDGVDKDDIEALLRATFQAASQFVPGGRQLRKTAEGAEAVIRGGSYKNGKLQYPVEGFGDTARALVFGKNATQAAREYWAAGGKALSDKQTGIYEGLLDEGMSRQEAYDTITGYRDEGTLNDFVKWQDSRSKTAGVDEETFMQFRQDTSGLEADKIDGKTVSGSLKEKVKNYIDGLDLTPDQKTALLLDYNSSYSMKGVEWSNGPAVAPAPTAAPTQAPEATPMPTATPEPETPGLTYRGQQYYDGFVAAGIREDAADTLARKLENNETSGHEQWRAIYNAANYSDREKAVTSVMNDRAKRNWELAKNAGCSLDDYISVRENYLDLDENGKQKQSEWNATLDQYTFSTDEAKDLRIKGTLWQILTGSESTKNNPYDKDAGREVIDAKSGGSGSGSYAPARLRVRRQPWETGETEYQSRLRVAGASAPAAAGGRLRVSKK